MNPYEMDFLLAAILSVVRPERVVFRAAFSFTDGSAENKAILKHNCPIIKPIRDCLP